MDRASQVLDGVVPARLTLAKLLFEAHSAAGINDAPVVVPVQEKGRCQICHSFIILVKERKAYLVWHFAELETSAAKARKGSPATAPPVPRPPMLLRLDSAAFAAL